MDTGSSFSLAAWVHSDITNTAGSLWTQGPVLLAHNDIENTAGSLWTQGPVAWVHGDIANTSGSLVQLHGFMVTLQTPQDHCGHRIQFLISCMGS